MAFTYAKLYSGSPQRIDYTPVSAVSAGDVIVQGVQIRFATDDIAAAALGSLCVGGGVWDLPKASGALTDGATVYWDATDHEVTTTASGNIEIGTTVASATTAATRCYVLHNPN